MNNIMILSSSDPSKDSGHGPIEIRRALQRHGFNTVFITKYKPAIYNDDSIKYYYNAWETFVRGILRRVRHRIIRLITKNKTLDYYLRDMFSFFPLKSTNRLRKIAGFTPDAIVIFFMPEFINYLDLNKFYKKYKCKIFVGTVDMYPFTGVCHYSGGCKKYEESCGACPMLNSRFEYDLSWLMIKLKKYVSKRANLYGFTWTVEFETLMRSSSVYKNLPVVRVPLFITQLANMYMPTLSQKQEIRSRYGINENDFVVLTCAAGLSSINKGMYDIVEAIDIAINNNLELKKNMILVTAGRGELPHDPDVKKIIKLGHLSHDLLYQAYWLSDIYISASKEDVGPGTLAYAFLCGIPSVSYNTGLAPALIRNEENGFLVEKDDVKSLSERIIDFFQLENNVIKEWGSEIAESSKEFFDEGWAENLVAAIKN